MSADRASCNAIQLREAQWKLQVDYNLGTQQTELERNEKDVERVKLGVASPPCLRT